MSARYILCLIVTLEVRAVCFFFINTLIIRAPFPFLCTVVTSVMRDFVVFAFSMLVLRTL